MTFTSKSDKKHLNILRIGYFVNCIVLIVLLILHVIETINGLFSHLYIWTEYILVLFPEKKGFRKRF